MHGQIWWLDRPRPYYTFYMEPVGIRRPIGRGHGRPIRMMHYQCTPPVVMPGLWPYPFAYRPCMVGMTEEDLHKEVYDDGLQTRSSEDMDRIAQNIIPIEFLTESSQSQSDAPTTSAAAVSRIGRKRPRKIRHPNRQNEHDPAPAAPPADPIIRPSKLNFSAITPGPVNAESDSKDN